MTPRKRERERRGRRIKTSLLETDKKRVREEKVIKHQRFHTLTISTLGKEHCMDKEGEMSNRISNTNTKSKRERSTSCTHTHKALLHKLGLARDAFRERGGFKLTFYSPPCLLTGAFFTGRLEERRSRR